MTNKKISIIWILVITSFISIATIAISSLLLTPYPSNKAEPTTLAKEKRELAILDSLLSQKSYYQKQLASGLSENKDSINETRAVYLKKIIAEINKEIEKIVPPDTIKIRKDTIKK